VVAGETALARGALFCAYAFHLEASADGACTRGCERERGREENTDREPRVGFGFDSGSSSVRGFFAGKVSGEEGRLWSAGEVSRDSEPWEEGEE